MEGSQIFLSTTRKPFLRLNRHTSPSVDAVCCWKYPLFAGAGRCSDGASFQFEPPRNSGIARLSEDLEQYITDVVDNCPENHEFEEKEHGI